MPSPAQLLQQQQASLPYGLTAASPHGPGWYYPSPSVTSNVSTLANVTNGAAVASAATPVAANGGNSGTSQAPPVASVVQDGPHTQQFGVADLAGLASLARIINNNNRM